MVMARLQPFMNDLKTHPGRLAAAGALMDSVYGPCPPGTIHTWQPKPLADNRGRYLWTDAFGVCNFITLACETGKPHYLDQADKLINAVHNTLGRDRHKGHRLGSATDESPTLGGLRIGKVHPEGHPDGDGQYFHYLTKWAFALNRMSIARGEPKYNNWAVDLLKAAHPNFVHRDGGKNAHPRMFWKVSVDMKRPAVPSEGNLDPFDGLVTCSILRGAHSSVERDSSTPEDSSILSQEEADFREMVDAKWPRYHSMDPLDLGEALWLAHWALPENETWADAVSGRSLGHLEELWQDGYFDEPSGFRLAFREFGTTLGVQVNPMADASKWVSRVDALHEFWGSRATDRDSDITPVMMSASLVPGVWNIKYHD